MRILNIISQYRRDFTANLQCEACNYIQKNVSGYDDNNFHQNVIPEMKCPKCGEKADQSYRPLQPKYNENQIL